jgi:hypothetical protein
MACLNISIVEVGNNKGGGGNGGDRAVGTFLVRVPIVLTVRQKCQPGTVSESGRTPCSSCPINTYQDEEAKTSCKPCPPRGGLTSYTYATIGAVSPDMCIICPEGSRCHVFTQNTGSGGGDGGSGKSNATNTNASGNSSSRSVVKYVVKARNGFYREEACPTSPLHGVQWANGTLPLRFVECLRRESCVGAPNTSSPAMTENYMASLGITDDAPLPNLSQAINFSHDYREGCAAGYSGALCLACTDGLTKGSFGSSEESTCGECIGTFSTIMISLAAVLVASLGTLYLIHWALTDRGNLKNIGVELIKIGFNHLQLLAIMAAFPVRWPLLLRQFFALFDGISAGGSQLLSPDCLLSGSALTNAMGSPLYVKAIVTALTPLTAIAMIYVYFRLRTFGHDSPRVRREYDREAVREC